MKRAFVVCGPESSGNRMTAALLISAGCHGEAGVDAPLNVGLPSGESPVALVRSFPHGEESVPDLIRLSCDLRRKLYATTFIPLTRDTVACAASQVGRGHRKSAAEAREAITGAMGAMWSQLHLLRDVRIVPTTYEALAGSEAARGALVKLLGLQTPGDTVTVDGVGRGFEDENAKHYEVAR